MKTLIADKLFKDQYEKEYNKLLEEHLNDDINYGANTIKNADRGDLEQLCSDSFFYGYIAACKVLDKY